MMIDLEHVKKFIPHRDPFLFVDSIETMMIPGRDLKPGDIVAPKELVGAEVLGNYRTKEDHPIFTGHFPGNPILPGVVQIEMMAQVSSFLLTRTMEDPWNSNMDVALLSVSNSKFRRPIGPGVDLKIKAKCTKIRGVFMTHDCEIHVGDELVSQCTSMASVKFD